MSKLFVPGATPSQPSGIPTAELNALTFASWGRLPNLSGDLFVIVWSMFVITATFFE